MKKITEADLLRLNFERIDVDEDDELEDDENPYYYFRYVSPKDQTTLLLTTDEDNKNDIYAVEVGDYESIKIVDLSDLELLMGIINRATVND